MFSASLETPLQKLHERVMRVIRGITRCRTIISTKDVRLTKERTTFTREQNVRPAFVILAIIRATTATFRRFIVLPRFRILAGQVEFSAVEDNARNSND